MFPPSPVLPNVSVKAYRELMKRFRTQHEDVNTSSTLFLQAKQLAIDRLRSRGEKTKLNPSRAFSRLRDRILDAKKGLSKIKDDRKVKLKAGLEALRLQKVPARSLEQVVAVLGSNGLLRTVVVGAVGLLSRGFMSSLCTTEIRGREALDQALSRPEGQGMITVCNHSCALDDPLLLATIMPPGTPAEAQRWGTCATDRCFKNGLMAAFFRAGKTLPVERGVGMDQPGMRAAQGRLAAGEWVHIFPEGTRSRDGRMGPMRRGVGHLVSSCETPPLVLPFVHTGMEGILPKGASLPQTGQEVKVLFGEPINFLDLLEQAQEEGWGSSELSKAISQRVGDTLYSLKAQLQGVEVQDVISDCGLAGSEGEEALLPLIEEQMDSLRHSWRQQKLFQMWDSAATFRQQLMDRGRNARQQLSLQQMLGRFSQPPVSGSSMRALQDYFSAKTGAMRHMALAQS